MDVVLSEFKWTLKIVNGGRRCSVWLCCMMIRSWVMLFAGQLFLSAAGEFFNETDCGLVLRVPLLQKFCALFEYGSS